jgi:hypothetical protein
MRLLVGLILVLSSSSTFALTSLKNSCQITIQLKKVNGETQQIQFKSALKSKAQCKALALIHRNNFDPEKIRHKKVSYDWKQVKKSVPLVARKSSKKSRKIKF